MRNYANLPRSTSVSSILAAREAKKWKHAPSAIRDDDFILKNNHKSVTGRVKEQYTLSCWRIWLPEVPKCLGFPQGFNENFLAISIHLSSSVSYLKIGQERGYFGSNECQRFLLYCTFLCQKNVSLNSLECRLPISIEENKHHLVGEGVDGMYTYFHLCMKLAVWFFIWSA